MNSVRTATCNIFILLWTTECLQSYYDFYFYYKTVASTNHFHCSQKGTSIVDNDVMVLIKHHFRYHPVYQ